jgi:hypothetical protein
VIAVINPVLQPEARHVNLQNGVIHRRPECTGWWDILHALCDLSERPLDFAARFVGKRREVDGEVDGVAQSRLSGTPYVAALPWPSRRIAATAHVRFVVRP